MGIRIDDPGLEARVEALGQRQHIPVNKTAMATAILRAAVSDDRGCPVDKWSDKARKFSEPSAA